jgi:hypothetical protein
MGKKTWKKTVCVLLAAVLLLAVMPFACAEGAEPHGDGNGILSRPLLASLYKWLDGMDGEFRALLTFDEISNAVGKWGCLKEKSGEDTHAAYWTDGEDYVTVTFRNRDGYWGVTSIVTDLPRDEYMAADASFLPPVGNRAAGSSPAEPVTMSTKVKPSGEEANVTVQLPSENWFAKESFGELRYLNAPDESRVSSNSSGLRLSLWSDAESLRAEQEKGAENLADAESVYLLGMEMKGITYTRYGMDMTDYTAQLGENLFLRISVYKMDLYPGSEAEAIVSSLSVQCGDFSFSYEPLSWDDDPEDEPVLGSSAFSMDYITGSRWMAEEKIRLEEKPQAMMVYNNFSIEDLAFSHDLESDKWYSYADFDIRVINAETDHPLPLLRMWVTMVTKESSMDITSVTFTTGGRNYTFSGLSDEEDFTDKEGDFQQDMLILFDDNSMSFLYDLEISRLLGEETFKAVFHGSRDIEAEIGPNFWDIFSVYWDLYQNSGAAECLDGFEGTEMTSELAY